MRGKLTTVAFNLSVERISALSRGVTIPEVSKNHTPFRFPEETKKKKTRETWPRVRARRTLWREMPAFWRESSFLSLAAIVIMEWRRRKQCTVFGKYKFKRG